MPLHCADRQTVIRAYHPTGPVGRVPSNFGDHGDRVYLVCSKLCNWLSFFFAEDSAKLRCTVLFLSPDHLAEFNGETERRAEKRMCKGRGQGRHCARVRHGRSNDGKRGKTDEKKEGNRASALHLNSPLTLQPHSCAYARGLRDRNREGRSHKSRPTLARSRCRATDVGNVDQAKRTNDC